MSNIFAELLATLLRNVENQDRVRLVISGRELRHISLPFMSPDQLTVEKILSEIERVTQSNDAWAFEGTFMVNFVHVRLPMGGTYSRGIALLNKKEIQNKDEMCLARSIVTAKARLTNDKNYDKIRKDHWKLQESLAGELHEKAGVPKGVKCGLKEMKKFQSVLSPDFQLVVFSSVYFDCIFYNGPAADNIINIYHYNEHYCPITTMTGFLERAYYCCHCQKGFNNSKTHLCESVCSCCRDTPSCIFVKWQNCDKCRRVFKSEQCFNNHLITNQADNSVCDLFKKCAKCQKVYDMRTTHECFTSYCNTCGLNKPTEHKCFIKKPKQPKKDKGNKMGQIQKLIFFDFESTQERELDNGDKQHIPNLCIAHRCCSWCGLQEKPHDTEDFRCVYCTNSKESIREEVLFEGENTVKEFCDWLFDGKKNGSIAIAHNSRGYDAFFIIDYLHAQGIKPVAVIQMGQKILSFEAKGVKFLDSLSFLPMPLSNFPKTFNLTEMKKGYFPHFFNREENWNYIGLIPDIRYFNPDAMTTADRQKFMTWYEQQQEKLYDFKNELISYCRSDVDILRRGCTKFIELFECTSHVNPFKNSVTIASACSFVFRQNFMKPSSIAVLPPYGYIERDKQSAIAIKWLEWEMKNKSIFIQHSGNSGEKHIGNYKVDGFDDVNKIVYEFEGCFWHGCGNCYPNRETMNPHVGVTMGELSDDTNFRRNFLRECGFTVISKKECEFKDEIKNSVPLQVFTKDLVLLEPLNPRDAFFGGRTNAVKLYHKCDKNEAIKYVDFTSLYPWVCKYQHYALGHPEIYRGESLNQIDPLSCEGLIKCKILPPKGLYLPVLPIRIDKKLKFTLCSICARTCQNKCNHSEEERSLSGTWVIFEVIKAIEKGYKLLETHEVWHFPETTKYDPSSSKKDKGGIFAEYIDHFLKVKQQASGWPEWCKTHSDKDTYLENYEKNEGIKLQESLIAHNPGLRSIAKLCLNSLWGKFGQRSNFTNTVYVSEPEEYVRMMMDDGIEITDVQHVNDEFVLIKFRNQEEFTEPCPYTNTVIAAYTTAHARLKLYSELDKLGTQVLYFDTDSIIYVIDHTDQNHYDPPLGDYLGEFKDELDGKTIEEFVSGGAKNYAFRIKENHETTCKVRGFTLNYANSQRVNFESMKKMVKDLDFTTKIPICNPFKINRTKSYKIVTREEVKNYGLVYDKRYLSDDYTTLPFGFV
jgi:hypothetical protein